MVAATRKELEVVKREVRNPYSIAGLYFTSEAHAMTDHPALVGRAFLLACEARPKGRVRTAVRERRRLLMRLKAAGENGGKYQTEGEWTVRPP